MSEQPETANDNFKLVDEEIDNVTYDQIIFDYAPQIILPEAFVELIKQNEPEHPFD